MDQVILSALVITNFNLAVVIDSVTNPDLLVAIVAVDHRQPRSHYSVHFFLGYHLDGYFPVQPLV